MHWRRQQWDTGHALLSTSDNFSFFFHFNSELGAAQSASRLYMVAGTCPSIAYSETAAALELLAVAMQTHVSNYRPNSRFNIAVAQPDSRATRGKFSRL